MGLTNIFEAITTAIRMINRNQTLMQIRVGTYLPTVESKCFIIFLLQAINFFISTTYFFFFKNHNL